MLLILLSVIWGLGGHCFYEKVLVYVLFFIYVLVKLNLVFLWLIWISFDSVNVQPVWFDRVDVKQVLICYCRLGYPAYLPLSLIRLIPIVKKWPCCYGCLANIRSCVVLKLCRMHPQHTLEPKLRVRSCLVLFSFFSLLLLPPFFLPFPLFLSVVKCRAPRGLPNAFVPAHKLCMWELYIGVF